MNFSNFKGISTKNAIALSAIIDKMEIGQELKNMKVETGNEAADREELGKQLIVLLVSRLHKAENEIYNFIAGYKDITVEEAQKIDIIAFLKELFSLEGTIDFL